MGSEQVNLIGRQYNKCSLWVVAAATLATLLAISIYDAQQFVDPLVISAVYALVTNTVYCLSWKAVAKSSPNALGKFYLAGSALRMMLAVLVAVAYCVIVGDRDAILNFILVFSSFYVVMLVFDGVFFARMERKRNQKI